MPVYEYLCEECDGVFESVKAIREAEEPAPCPVCDTGRQACDALPVHGLHHARRLSASHSR